MVSATALFFVGDNAHDTESSSPQYKYSIATDIKHTLNLGKTAERVEELCTGEAEEGIDITEI